MKSCWQKTFLREHTRECIGQFIDSVIDIIFIYTLYTSTWTWCITPSQQKSVFLHFYFHRKRCNIKFWIFFSRMSVRYPYHNKWSISVLPTYVKLKKALFQGSGENRDHMHMKQHNIVSYLTYCLPLYICIIYVFRSILSKTIPPCRYLKMSLYTHKKYAYTCMCLRISKISFYPFDHLFW